MDSVIWLVGAEFSIGKYSRWRQAQNVPPEYLLLCISLHDVLTLTILWILTKASTSNPVPQNINNNWSINGHAISRKWNIKDLYVVYKLILIPCTFSTISVHCVSYLVTNKLRKWTIISINTHFKVRFIHKEFQCSTDVIRDVFEKKWDWTRGTRIGITVATPPTPAETDIQCTVYNLWYWYWCSVQVPTW